MMMTRKMIYFRKKRHKTPKTISAQPLLLIMFNRLFLLCNLMLQANCCLLKTITGVILSLILLGIEYLRSPKDVFLILKEVPPM
mmetsp:Transcript_12665/g.1881  ORF Transcript_12665/g.1881 Transcript_12665/m.1881 type:complete len:84 (+) Transcript_12665:268-519(+)